MVKRIALFIYCLLFPALVSAQPTEGSPATRWVEFDGSPDLRARTVIISNDTAQLSDDGVSIIYAPLNGYSGGAAGVTSVTEGVASPLIITPTTGAVVVEIVSADDTTAGYITAANHLKITTTSNDTSDLKVKATIISSDSAVQDIKIGIISSDVGVIKTFNVIISSDVGILKNAGYLTTASIDTSAEIAAIVGDETGTGVVVYSDSPTFTTKVTVPNTAFISGQKFSKSFVITNPTAAGDGSIWRCPVAATITAVHLLCKGNVVVGHLTEQDANGLNDAGVDGATDITGVVDTNVDDDGALSNGSIDAGDYIGWRTTSIVGTPSMAVITFEGYIN